MKFALRMLDRLWQLPFLVIGFLLSWVVPFLKDVGGMVMFLWVILKHLVKPPFEVRELMFQLYAVGVKSIPVVIISGIFVGAIVGIQFEYALGLFGARQYLGGITTSGVLREVGPVLVSIMIAGRVGAYITAELGTMKVTEQIDAVRCLGANPIQFLVVPRFIAVTVMVFVLTIVGLVVATMGGAFAVWLMADMGPAYYFESAKNLNAGWALLNGMAKGLLFGVLLSTIACYKGFTTEGGTEGVGRAVNSCLVVGSLAIFITDYLLASIASVTFKVAESLLFFGQVQ